MLHAGGCCITSDHTSWGPSIECAKQMVLELPFIPREKDPLLKSVASVLVLICYERRGTATVFEYVSRQF